MERDGEKSKEKWDDVVSDKKKTCYSTRSTSITAAQYPLFFHKEE